MSGMGMGDLLAYIDPNAGGPLYQVLFPVLVALGGLWMFLKERITRFFGGIWVKARKKKEP